MEGSVEAQTIVSPTKEVNLEAVVAEPVQHNGVEDVVSTNGASEIQDEIPKDDTVEVKKRKSLDGEGDQEIECKRLKTTHPEGEESAVAEETNAELIEEKTDAEELKPEAEESKPETEELKPESEKKTEQETMKEVDEEEKSKMEESKEEKEVEPEAQK